MEISQVYHIEITEDDIMDVMNNSTLNFQIDGKDCIMTRKLTL